MRFDAVVFDFDGTLVDSAGVKYQAFFGLFPDTPAHREVVTAVLDADPDGSRHVVIPRMIAELARRDLHYPAHDLIAAYGVAVERGVRAAPECPGAGALLSRLKDHAKLYIASNTPRQAVASEAAARGWAACFAGIHGHPERKIDVVRDILVTGAIDPPRLAVVGDGVSDEVAAAANHCTFIRIARPDDLMAAARQLEISDV